MYQRGDNYFLELMGKTGGLGSLCESLIKETVGEKFDGTLQR